MASRLCLILGIAAGVAAEPFVMLMKSISREQVVYGESFDVKLRVFNKGDSPAYGVTIKDGDWSPSMFELIKGAKETALDVLDANSNATHSFTLRPLFAGEHAPAAATVGYAPSSQAARTTHTSNLPAKLPVLSRAEKYTHMALTVGRVLSLNFVRTVWGWCMVALFWGSLFGLVGLIKLQKKMRVWRHERAVAEIEKMK